ncbi:hypothetical protein N7489_004686 [Penicillium chrysogenum]|uniref:uncharacterized protein n=1 Tax=Penicillium chrysogenum TaxID=5076 RepID=UPI0024DF1E0A|nr:uncharacterized protein N7489_004686 [Penicillium chrysogenum]KAJ5244590.1 hypothetical protein N7489_004686 [Penicillium chrysogenum]
MPLYAVTRVGPAWEDLSGSWGQRVDLWETWAIMLVELRKRLSRRKWEEMFATFLEHTAG